MILKKESQPNKIDCYCKIQQPFSGGGVNAGDSCESKENRSNENVFFNSMLSRLEMDISAVDGL